MDIQSNYESAGGTFLIPVTSQEVNLSMLTNASARPAANLTTNQSNLPPPPQSDTITLLSNIIYVLDEFGVPTILTVGVIINVILGMTIRNTDLKKVSSCCYFYALSIADTTYLIAMAIPWFSARVVDIYNTKGFCQLVYYFNLLTTFLGSWYVVMLLSERLLVSYRQDIALKHCTAFKTKCYVTVLSIFSIVGHLYLTWTSGISVFHTMKMCMVLPENAKDILVVRKVDIVFSFIMPTFLCLILMIPLIVFLCAHTYPCKNGTFKFETKRMAFEVKLTSKRPSRYMEKYKKDSGSFTELKIRLRKFKHSRRMTLVSVIIAFIYFTLFIPHNILKSRITFMNGTYNVTIYDSLFLRIFEELFKFNFAYKPFVYFILLPEMRNQFIKLFFSRCHRLWCQKNKDDLEVVTTL